MIKTQPEARLLQLDSYLHPTAAPAATPQPIAFDDPTSPWNGKGLRLFLSHHHEHAVKAGELRDALAARSVDVFVAHTAIEATEEWERVILAALKSSDACAALLTPEFATSVWCDQEVGFCMARDKLVVPLEYGATPYGFLGRYQALSVTGKPVSDVALSIFELLVRKPQSRDAMARVLVSRWADTNSWDAARENFGFLKKIPAESWTQQLVSDVWEARERERDLRTANLEWKASDVALDELFADLRYSRPQPDDDIPF
ncbi:MAG: toll/interleukin-1 receptor domain-containing protein [Solirubrobacteraceae bacterium]